MHRNDGLRKVCGCARRAWVKCPHPWHFNFSWLGAPYRFSLNRYAGKDVASKTEAEALAEKKIRTEIRAGTYQGTTAIATTREQRTASDVVSFETFARLFIERYSKDRGKASWRDDEYMTRQLVSFRVVHDTRLGDKPVQLITQDDLEAFIKHLVTLGRAASTRNHYVQLIKAMSRWAVRKGYRSTPFIDESDVIRRRKEAQRHRRLEQGEEERLLRAAGSHLEALIIAALETCCREGELLSLRWCDVSLARGEMVVRAEHAKDREQRILPISTRLCHVLDMRGNGPEHLPQRNASRAARVDAEPRESTLRLQTACKHSLPRATACSQAGSRH